jgi:hypothetical protein
MVSQHVCKGGERKSLAKEIITSHHSNRDQILIYCRSLGPNPTLTHPTWTAVCVAFRQGQEIGHQVSILGQNASTRDAAFQAVANAADLAKDTLAGSPSSSVTILTADHFVLPYCQITDHHDNATACRAICDTAATILSTHPTTTLSIRWIPGKMSFQPLERLQNIVIAVAAQAAPDLLITAPTPDAL